MGEKSKFKDYYEAYDQLQVWEPGVLKKVVKYIKEPVLDVGCYRGEKTKFYYDLGFKKIEGCDISEGKIKDANKLYPKIKFFYQDFEKNSTNKKYNTIYSFEVIEHLFDTDMFLQNIWNSLNMDGMFILSTPNICCSYNRVLLALGDGKRMYGSGLDGSHIRFFTKSTLSEFLEKNGFEILHFSGYNVRPFLKNIPMPTTYKEGFVVVAKKVGKK